MKTILFIALLFYIPVSFAQVKLIPIFSDHMVLQQQTDAPIWGKAKAGSRIEIITSWDKKKHTAQTDANGNWKIKVSTPQAGGPYTITISDGKPVTLSDVMIGEVWLCSGQSNMEMQVEGWGKITNYEQEKAEAGKYPNIRFLQVEKATSPVPLNGIKAAGGGWQVCSAKTVADFSAVGYFFGRDIHKNQDVPVGLINSSWGGTIAETWTSGESLETMPDFKKGVEWVRQLPTTAEEQNKVFQVQLNGWKKEVDRKDPGYKDGKPIWASPQLDDNWDEMQVPGLMQEQGLTGFNGIVWFRKIIDIPASWEGKELTLNLGAVDDNDFTYFNGEEIGYTEGWMANRAYKIPGKMVKKGKAVITVRVIDTGGSGGFHGDAANVYIRLSKSDSKPLAGTWKYKVSLHIKDLPVAPVNISGNPNFATLLYNAMLHPIVPFQIKGAIWYQGESNAGRAYQYRELLPLMITDWRKQWGYEFPFYLVQLANFTQLQTVPVESTWAELREAQTQTLHLNNTGMAVTIDIGDAFDIHPKNKQDVGKRLALAALAQTYGQNIPFSGPVYESYRIEGNRIRIFFKQVDNGLKTKDNEPVKGFTIAGLDHKFHWADAVIDGNTIVVSSTDVSFPIAVRYAWADNPVCNLYNGADLPACPFRTDDWQGITYGVK